MKQQFYELYSWLFIFMGIFIIYKSIPNVIHIESDKIIFTNSIKNSIIVVGGFYVVIRELFFSIKIFSIIDNRYIKFISLLSKRQYDLYDLIKIEYNLFTKRANFHFHGANIKSYVGIYKSSIFYKNIKEINHNIKIDKWLYK